MFKFKEILTAKISRKRLDEFVLKYGDTGMTLDLREETDTKDTFVFLGQRLGYQTEFRFNKAAKLAIFFFSKVIQISPSFIKREFGDINRRGEEKNILTSGYYLACEKI